MSILVMSPRGVTHFTDTILVSVHRRVLSDLFESRVIAMTSPRASSLFQRPRNSFCAMQCHAVEYAVIENRHFRHQFFREVSVRYELCVLA